MILWSAFSKSRSPERARSSAVSAIASGVEQHSSTQMHEYYQTERSLHLETITNLEWYIK